MVVGGGVQKLLFDAEGCGEGGGGSKNYFLMLSPKIIKSQIPITVGGGGGGSKNYFLMLSPKIIKSQIPIMGGGGDGGGGGGVQNLTFDAKSKNHKIPKTHLTSMNSKLQMTH